MMKHKRSWKIEHVLKKRFAFAVFSVSLFIEFRNATCNGIFVRATSAALRQPYLHHDWYVDVTWKVLALGVF